MKVNGIENKKEAALKHYPVQRGDAILLFTAQPVWSFDDFHDLCPQPIPGPASVVFTPNGKKVNYECPQYKADLAEWARKRWGYMILKSLEPSNLELDGISLADPKTWGNVEEVLRAELSHFEFAGVMKLIDEVNGLDQAKLDENLQNFFTAQAKKAE